MLQPTQLSSAAPRPFSRRRLLVVEGNDESRFFTALARHLDIGEFDTHDMRGRYDWPAKMKAVVRTPGFERVEKLGLVRDADDDPAGAFQSVCTALSAADLPVPPAPLASAVGAIAVSVLIIPGDNEPGCLEDLCLRTVSTDPIMACIDGLVSCVERNASEMPDHLSKARLQTFIALKPGRCKLLGEAADAQYWAWGHESLVLVCDFLRSLLA